MSRIARFLFALLLVAPLAGCVGSEEVAEGPEAKERWDEGRLRNHLRLLTEPIVPMDSVHVARRTLYAAQRMETAGLMPARDPSFLVRMRSADPGSKPGGRVDPTHAHVLGYVAGRHPSHYGELVVVAADLNSPGASAVLAVARELAAQARFTQVPERTVLFALWSPPRTGTLGLTDFLANPTWALLGIRRVLLVTDDSSSAAESQRLLEMRGIRSDVVDVTDQSIAVEGAGPDVAEARTLARVVRLADALYAQTLAAAAARDSTATSP